MQRYIGRFAPSPTGPLHAGSLVAALASWLDARAQNGQWRVRLEDIDTTRCVPAASGIILNQLSTLGLLPDGPVLMQSQRLGAYRAALEQLAAQGQAYPCACSRQVIEQAQAARGLPHSRHGERIYPGTCRPEHGGLRGQAARAWRMHTEASPVPPGAAHRATHSATQPAPQQVPDPAVRSGGATLAWHDRRLGRQTQDVAAEVGDFVLLRADGCFAYQLAVVVDDAAQEISDVVRGEDLADNTARQILLQGALGLPTPRYLHTPLLCDASGNKLSKQTGAAPLDTQQPLASLGAAAQVLGLHSSAARSQTPGLAVGDWLAAATAEWAAQAPHLPTSPPKMRPVKSER